MSLYCNRSTEDNGGSAMSAGVWEYLAVLASLCDTSTGLSSAGRLVDMSSADDVALGLARSDLTSTLTTSEDVGSSDTQTSAS